MPARATSSGKDVAIQKLAWITEHDVMGFSPYQAQDGTFGALFQLDDHGRVVLDTLSVERRGDHRTTDRQASVGWKDLRSVRTNCRGC